MKRGKRSEEIMWDHLHCIFEAGSNKAKLRGQTPVLSIMQDEWVNNVPVKYFKLRAYSKYFNSMSLNTAVGTSRQKMAPFILTGNYTMFVQLLSIKLQLECHYQLNFTNRHQNALQRFKSYFLFSAVSAVLVHHQLSFVLILSSCEQLLHFICTLHCGIIMSINSTLKSQVTVFVHSCFIHTCVMYVLWTHHILKTRLGFVCRNGVTAHVFFLPEMNQRLNYDNINSHS